MTDDHRSAQVLTLNSGNSLKEVRSQRLGTQEGTQTLRSGPDQMEKDPRRDKDEGERGRKELGQERAVLKAEPRGEGVLGSWLALGRLL